MQQIPIIILNWNGIEDTLECIPSVLEQSYDNFIVYLVDNGSNENNVRLLKEHFADHSKIELIFNTTNLGFTKGNNVILKQVLEKGNTPYVVLLNNDTVVEFNWLENLVRSAKENKAHIVASKMVNYFNRKVMDNAGHRMINTGEVVTIGGQQAVEAYQSAFGNMGACAGAALYDTMMLRKIGIFDEYFDTGYEDAELGVRAAILGYKTIFEPSAVVYHKVSRSISKIVNYDYMLKVQTNILYTNLKLMPSLVLLINFPSFLIKSLLVLLVNLIFWRTIFLKTFIQALYIVLFKDRSKILRNRNVFFEQQQAISSINILRKQEFFLWYDVKRFVNEILFKNKTLLEKELE